MNNKILICGHRSFVATGLTDVMKKYNIDCDCFSRGQVQRVGNVVTGDVMQMVSNPELGQYDTVINFIILKDASIEQNLVYVQALLDFCKHTGVKHLIQISSIAVYPNDAALVNEESELESPENKSGYAAIKLAVDKYILEHPVDGLQVTFVRPGYVYAKNAEISKAGLVVSKFGIHILLGDKKTVLPIINRVLLHEALTKIVLADKKEDVYLIFNSNANQTKYNFVSRQWNIHPVSLPTRTITFAARCLNKVGVFSNTNYKRVIGLFKRTHFDNHKTEECLSLQFKPRRFAVLGAGTYGCYISNLLSLVYPQEEIDLYDVGDENIKDEAEIGFASQITGANYVGLHKGRFFGLGGASTKWGGQLLTFGDNDFKTPNALLQDIIRIDKKYKDAIYARFNLENKIADEKINDDLTIKTGVWLSYFHRDLYRFFGIAKNPKITIHRNCRVSRILVDANQKVTGFEYIQKGEKKQSKPYEYYFLTSGAFESGRLLIASGLASPAGQLPFGDHLSQRAFYVTSGPKIGPYDFTFKIQGASLITKRIIGEVDGSSFFSQPINNEDFPFFSDLKKLLFGHHFSARLMWDIVKNIPACFAFAWDFFVLKKLYVHKNSYYLQVDIEAPADSGKMQLSEENDSYKEPGLDVNLKIVEHTGELFVKARQQIKDFLDANGATYTELPFSTTAEKYEDTYHPFGIYSDYDSIEDYFGRFRNMLVANTGILPRAGGINSTAAVFPLIEEYVNNIML